MLMKVISHWRPFYVAGSAEYKGKVTRRVGTNLHLGSADPHYLQAPLRGIFYEGK